MLHELDDNVTFEADGRIFDIDASLNVVVSTGGGHRFHLPGGQFFHTACSLEFDHMHRNISIKKAIREGFSPCQKPNCVLDMVA